jgi:alpha-1,3/alpha-1,6-mannosyltransferase
VRRNSVFLCQGAHSYRIGQADVILSNSEFTSKVYAKAFPSLAKRKPKVVYPCIDAAAYQAGNKKGKGKAQADDEATNIISS